MEDKLITIDEVCVILQLKPQSVRNLYKKKGLPVVRLGSNLIRFKQSDIDNYIAGKYVTYKT